MKKISTYSLSVALTHKINQHVQREGKDLQKMLLGMQILLHNIPKMILIITVSYFLGILPQTLITWFSFAIIRSYASGLHANNGITCAIMSLIMFVAIPYSLQGIYIINAAALVLFFVIAMFGLYKYAPADTAARPIIGKNKRVRLKKRALAASIVLLVIALLFLNENHYVLVTTGVSYALICILPITYKLMKRSMNNYEQHE